MGAALMVVVAVAAVARRSRRVMGWEPMLETILHGGGRRGGIYFSGLPLDIRFYAFDSTR